MNDKEQIINLITEAYINGIHKTQDENLVRKGFHKDFQMLVKTNGELNKIDIKKWLLNLKEMIADNPDLWSQQTNWKLLDIDISGDSASIKLEVYKGDTFFSYDYMLLYKFGDSWKIVAKIFTVLK